MSDFKCEECGKKCEELFIAGPYNGNKDEKSRCEDCFIDFCIDRRRKSSDRGD